MANILNILTRYVDNKEGLGHNIGHPRRYEAQNIKKTKGKDIYLFIRVNWGVCENMALILDEVLIRN